jgi:hypothetical protein
MPAFYKIDTEHKLVMTTASGVFDLATALAHREQLVNDPEFSPEYSQLLDFTQITKVELNVEDVRKISERSIFWPCSRRAILVHDDLLFGFSRMFGMLRENAGEKGIRVFRNLDDALDWIFEGNVCD